MVQSCWSVHFCPLFWLFLFPTKLIKIDCYYLSSLLLSIHRMVNLIEPKPYDWLVGDIIKMEDDNFVAVSIKEPFLLLLFSLLLLEFSLSFAFEWDTCPPLFMYFPTTPINVIVQIVFPEDRFPLFTTSTLSVDTYQQSCLSLTSHTLLFLSCPFYSCSTKLDP